MQKSTYGKTSWKHLDIHSHEREEQDGEKNSYSLLEPCSKHFMRHWRELTTADDKSSMSESLQLPFCQQRFIPMVHNDSSPPLYCEQEVRSSSNPI
mmetsp:Transcript_1478/g.3148  ORF Transcript_1478/g.3148 Transcript_1478/m.3148 type:complete len:96 (+) Transcript_1478:898-1185(+)